MKSRILILASLFVMVLFACQNQPAATAEADAGEEEVSTARTVSAAPNVNGAFTIPAGSTLAWTGSKPVGKSHNGTIDITSGNLNVSNGMITGGEFTIDMTTIKDLDIENEKMNAKLVGHLSSPDFFDVANHPTASFQITKAEPVADREEGNYSITGDLTIKGITHEINFPAQITVSEDGVSTTAKAGFQIDRSKWEVKFGSTNFFEDLVGDKIISNEIDIALDFNAQAAQS